MSEFDDSLRQVIAILARAYCPSGVRYLIKLSINHPGYLPRIMITDNSGYIWSFDFRSDGRLDMSLELCELNQNDIFDRTTITMSSPNFIADLSTWLDRCLLNSRARQTDELFDLFDTTYEFISSGERYSDK